MPGAGGSGGAGAVMLVNRGEKPKKPDLPTPGIELRNPVEHKLGDYARTNLAEAKALGEIAMVEKNAFAGQVLALCGAGPSLASDPIYPADQVWGANSAVVWLAKNGRSPDAAIGIDQTPGMLRDWADPPDVTYYIATTCDPELVRHLRSHKRRIVWFHNATGFDGEMEHYMEDWPPAFMIGSGASVIPRVLGLAATWFGFRRVDVYGADCSFGKSDQPMEAMSEVREHDVVHASGSKLEEAYGARTQVLQAEIQGRWWRARADMLMSAVDLVRRVRMHPGHVRLMGDTLAVALMGYDDEYLDQVIRRLEPGENPLENGASRNGLED